MWLGLVPHILCPLFFSLINLFDWHLKFFFFLLLAFVTVTKVLNMNNLEEGGKVDFDSWSQFPVHGQLALLFVAWGEPGFEEGNMVGQSILPWGRKSRNYKQGQDTPLSFNPPVSSFPQVRPLPLAYSSHELYSGLWVRWLPHDPLIFQRPFTWHPDLQDSESFGELLDPYHNFSPPPLGNLVDPRNDCRC